MHAHENIDSYGFFERIDCQYQGLKKAQVDPCAFFMIQKILTAYLDWFFGVC